MGSDRTPLGLRERRKQRTHDELLRAGLDLFLTRGYGRTTVGGIAECADVSERTFFRYFASKEELVLYPMREASRRFQAEVAARPPEEDPLRALQEAGRDAIRAVLADPLRRCLAALRVICAEPEARAACLRFGTEEQRRLATVLAQREGTEPGDLRPELLASVYTMTSLQAAFSWDERGDGSTHSLQGIAEAHLVALRSALETDWSSRSGS